MYGQVRRIGPIGVVARSLAAVALIRLAFGHGTSWGLGWTDAVIGLVILPGAILAVALVAARRGTRALHFTGPAGLAANCVLLIALLTHPYTQGGAALFYGLTLPVAVWRGQPGCEATVISNWILRRDDQVGCPLFSPIDALEACLTGGRDGALQRLAQHDRQ